MLATPKNSSHWLSVDMAHGLASMCPPLETLQIVRAADSLADGAPTACAVDRLLQQGVNQRQAHQVVEALCALRDAHT